MLSRLWALIRTALKRWLSQPQTIQTDRVLAGLYTAYVVLEFVSPFLRSAFSGVWPTQIRYWTPNLLGQLGIWADLAVVWSIAGQNRSRISQFVASRWFVLAIVAHVAYRVFGQIQAVEGFFRFASPDARGYWQSLTSVLLASVRNMNNLLLWSAIPLLYRHWLVLGHEQPSSSLTDGKAARAGVPALGYACAALLLNGISLALFAVYMSIETVRVMPFLVMRVPAATGAAEILRAVMSWLTVLSWGCQLLLFVRCYVAARRASASAP